MNIVNKVKVNICGKEYNLQTDESAEYITQLAVRVDKEISNLIKLKPGFGVQNAAVFVALTSLDEASKASESIDNIRTQIKTYVDDAAKARAAKDKLTAKVKTLEARIAELEKENKELKKRPPVYECEQLVLENTIPAVTVYAGEEQSEKEEAKEADTISASAENKEEANEKAAVDDNGSSASTDPEEGCEEKSQPEEIGKDDGSGAENPEAENDGADAQNDDIKRNCSGKKRKRH